MRRIVVATDGSPSALEAVEFGLDLAAEEEAEVTLVYVAPGLDVVPVAGFGFGAVSVPHHSDEHDHEPLEQAEKIADLKGIEVKTKVLTGNAVDAISAYAESVGADLIVVGCRGHGAFSSALLGSVSRGLLHEAGRPVVVVRGAVELVEALA